VLKQRPQPTRTGFTLLEMLITIAIVGILASVAYPSYLAQVRKGRRADAIHGLAQVMQTQERWRANNPNYASNSLLTTPWPDGLGISSTTAGAYYTLTISDDPSGAAYTVSAVARGNQAGDTACITLTATIDKGTVTSTPATCWGP
jgi:type IV pilus assembly protein PilE